MKIRTLISSAVLAVLAVSATAQSVSAQRIEIGSVESVINGFAAQHSDARSKFAHTLGANTLGVDIKNYFNKHGQFSISGTALGNKNSAFMLKGSNKALRGFAVYHDTGKAFEYSTDARGVVSITEVPIQKIIPDYGNVGPSVNVKARIQALAAPAYSSMALGQARHIGPYANQDVTKLESRPGSTYVYYLNLAEVMDGTTPINGVSKTDIYRMWQAVTDQFSSLQLNVTTNLAVYEAAKEANILRTGTMDFPNEDGRSWAYIGGFGSPWGGKVYRDAAYGGDYGYGSGRTAAHEVGHVMGLGHDGGTGGVEYFEGIPAFQWVPIMGNFWFGDGWQHPLYTFSKGEYNTANNQQDDFTVMTVDEGVPYAVDSNPQSKALVLGLDGDISPVQNFGQIERNTDTDTFTFSLNSAGSLNLRIEPIEFLSMLDVDATIYNSANVAVAQSNLSVDRSAEFVGLNLAAGAYKLVIKGGAEGTPQDGFSNYSSVGYYAMKGKLTGGGVRVLQNGMPAMAESSAAGAWNYYAIDVPSGTAKVTFKVSGFGGNADIYAKLGTQPSQASYQCKSTGATSNEACSLDNPVAGRYYLGVYANGASYFGLTVSARY